MMTQRTGRRQLRLEWLEDRTTPATFNWLGGQANDSWFAPANWDVGGGAIPGLLDTAVLGPGTSGPVLQNLVGVPTGVTVQNLILDTGYAGVVDLAGQTLLATQGLTMRDGTLSNGTLLVDNLANQTNVEWVDGTIRDLTLEIGVLGGQPTSFIWNGGQARNSSIELSADVQTWVRDAANSSNDIFLQNTQLTNRGILYQSHSMRFESGAANAATVANYGTWDLTGGVSLRRVINLPIVDLTFENYGLFRQSTTSSCSVVLDFNNHLGGAVRVEASNSHGLFLQAKGTQDGSFFVATGSNIGFDRLSGVGGIPVGASATHTLSSTATLTGPGTYWVSYGTRLVVQNNAALTVNNLVLYSLTDNQQDTSSLEVNGQLDVQNMEWFGGTIKGSGQLTLATGGTMNIDKLIDKWLEINTFLVYGTIHWKDWDLTMKTGSNVVIEAGGQFLLECNNSIKIDAPGNSPTPEIFVRPGGFLDNVPPFMPKTIDAKIKNLGGTIGFRRGVGRLGASFEHLAGLTVLEDATLAISGDFLQEGGTVQVDDTSTLTVDGAADVIGGTLELVGGTVSAPELDLGAAATLTGYGTLAADVRTAGTVQVLGNSGVVLAVTGDFTQSGGSVTGCSGPLQVAGTLTVAGGQLTSWWWLNGITAASYTQTGGSVSAYSALAVAGPVTVSGGSLSLTTWSGAGLSAGSYTQSGGSALVQGGVGLAIAGDFRVEGGTAILRDTSGSIGGQLVAAGGTAQLAGGTVTVSGGVQVLAGGLLEIGSGSYQSGRLIGNLSNQGVVRLGAPGSGYGDWYTLTGNYTQGSGGRLVMDVEYYGAADQLAVSGTATLDGVFELQLGNPYRPGYLHWLPVLPVGSRSGTFASLVLPGGASWTPLYDGNDMIGLGLWVV